MSFCILYVYVPRICHQYLNEASKIYAIWHLLLATPSNTAATVTTTTPTTMNTKLPIALQCGDSAKL